LSLCFRANVWNIGAEGQYIVGALAAGWVAMQAGPGTSRAIVVVVALAGAAGGMAWAAIVAVLRDRANASEILVSLMLVYVAELLLAWLVYGPWKDPQGYNFPQTITFLPVTRLPRLADGLRAHVGVVVALVAVVACWAFLFRSFHGFRLQVGVWRRWRRAMPATRRAVRCGRRCCCRAAWRGWRVRSRRPGRSASSRPTCRPATASRPSSSPSSAGCTRRASCSPAC
jgi:hypothetical protein